MAALLLGLLASIGSFAISVMDAVQLPGAG
jgi:hypothetical protein